VRIKIVSTDLAAGGFESAAGVSINSREILDEAFFFRGPGPTFFNRGTEGVVLQFSVTRQFNTPRDAEVFCLTHPGSVPKTGLVQVTAGDTGYQQIVYLQNAAVESIEIASYVGISVVVRYSIRGASFTTDIPPDVPGTVGGSETVIVMRRGKVAIASGARTVTVTFSAPLSNTPQSVTCSISRPAGGAKISADVNEDSITTAGFTAELTGPTPDANYKLHYAAIE
jgi:hypothetical protein